MRTTGPRRSSFPSPMTFSRGLPRRTDPLSTQDEVAAGFPQARMSRGRWRRLVPTLPKKSFPFLTLPGAKAASSTVLDLVQCLPGTTDPGCFNDFVWSPVLDRSSGLDLRGKTVQIVTTRDFRKLPPDVVEKLNENWKAYGIVWAGV